MSDEVIHKPVLLKEVIEHLKIDPDSNYIDCTLGDGGYSIEILGQLEKGSLLSIDCDKASVDFVRKKYGGMLGDGKWVIVQENFVKLEEIVKKHRLENIGGIVFDLGLSSRQLEADESNRGFSYIRPGPLDMRMDERLSVTAEDLLRGLSASELTELFQKYGEERFSRRIAREIKKWIKENPDKKLRSDTIAALVRKVVPASYRKGSKHPARRVFQALRIAVNDELLSLQEGLSSALSIVSEGGRVVVVSYHSLEDRIVKEMFNDEVRSGLLSLITKKPIVAASIEITRNPRARAAKLRVAEKIKEQ
jgi:16S rRNA (cytosine1402-N4)-methyltransferase